MTPTDPERLQQIGRLLDDALDLPPGDRTVWLEQLRQREPAIAPEVEAMLRGEAALEGRHVLDTPVWSTVIDPTVSLAGQRVGAYTLESAVGRGGMGSVWRAHRSDGRFDGTVAFKFINLALLDAPGVARFQREGTLLGRLSHPNIARLLDAGVTDSGQPYLVLEYVDGVPIDTYCNTQRLTPEARIRLMLDVLAAVAHAHANLVVHRDLKPSNILVTADGTVKLLDFGIAKLLHDESDAAQAEILTEAGGRLLTPDYAAPEQVTGDPITTATDVYALGVLLYVLLSGRHPTRTTQMGSSELLQSVLQVEPPRLTAALATLPNMAAVATERAMSVDKLRRTYRGDLGNIVARALRKDPTERYPSATALADDLRRFLQHEPVAARSDSVAYRLRKFVRRNRVNVAAGVAVFVALLTATIITAQQSVAARTERDEARKQRDLAVQEQRRATAASNFLQSVVQAVPDGAPFTSSTLMAYARKILEQDYAGDPRFAARMMLDLANGFEAVDDAPNERAFLVRAAELAKASGDGDAAARAQCRLSLWTSRDPDSASVAEPYVQAGDHSMSTTARVSPEAQVTCLLAHARIVGELGTADSALALGERALSVAETSGDTVSMPFVALLSELGDMYHNNNQVRRAMQTHQRRARILEQIGRSNSVLALRSQQRVASALRDLGEMRLADSVTRGTLALARRIDSLNIPPYVTVLVGEVARGNGQLDSAASVMTRALDDAMRQGDAFRASWARSQLIYMLADAGHVPEAMAQLAVYRKNGVAVGNGQLAMFEARIALARGEPKAALPTFLSALRDIEFPNSRDSPPFHRIAYHTARAALALGDFRMADTIAGHTIRLERLMGHVHDRSVDIGLSMLIRAKARLAMGDTAAARAALDTARVAMRAGVGPDFPQYREAELLARRLPRP